MPFIKGVKNLHIDKNEVLRYLGYRSTPDKLTERLMDECILEIEEDKSAGYEYKVFDIEVTTDEITILNTLIRLSGSDISKHLKHSSKCAIMAATLGSSIDSRLRYYKKTDIAKACVFDACASAAIEGVCDYIENKIRLWAFEKYGLSITSRYSPGYGNLPLSTQGHMIGLLNASIRIGLTATENYILIPSKSVTAIIGFIDKNNEEFNSSCENCNISQSCLYKKGGDYCGHSRIVR